MNIDKSTFNALNIQSQVKFFNSMLKEHKVIKTVCNIIGISYSTIRDRFNKKGYVYNKFTCQYEYENLYVGANDELEEKIIELINKNTDKNNNQITKRNYNSNLVVRSFRVHECVLSDFIKFCENSTMNQYDIMSLFLTEGMRKYQ